TGDGRARGETSTKQGVARAGKNLKGIGRRVDRVLARRLIGRVRVVLVNQALDAIHGVVGIHAGILAQIHGVHVLHAALIEGGLVTARDGLLIHAGSRGAGRYAHGRGRRSLPRQVLHAGRQFEEATALIEVALRRNAGTDGAKLARRGVVNAVGL